MKSLLELKRDKYPNHKVTISSVIKLSEKELKNSFKNIFKDLYPLIDDIYLYPLSFTAKIKVEDLEHKITKKCPIPFRDVYINSDCTLGFCCKDYFDEISFGSLLDTDFMDLYKSNHFEELRKMHNTGEFPDNHLCKKCLLFGRNDE